MNTISDITQILNVIQGKTKTNCFLLPNEIEILYQKGELHCYKSGDNVVFLQDRANSKRLYYFIKDFDSIIELPEESDYLCEVIYRGETIPEKEIVYLERLGFERNAIRSIYQLLYKEVTPYVMRSGCEIRLANNLDEVEEACQLFNATFDNISGDFISPEECETLLTVKAITVAIDENGKIAGAYQHDCAKNVAWGRHLAVKGGYRGRSVGKDLLYDYIERYHEQGANRYMLWCTIDNTAAVRMYDSTGFKTIGRNCISMVKTKKIK